ncbi:virulence factor TspB C-terminal domain-related protein [Aquabacterium sp. CECT 9606]|uniref:virulence factor TspB C-terminal domain-related protein n=1 Tax=Aquabacterium sp. CECT 9606 TaxID=2845822 RepID=UPI0035300F70
MACRHDAPQNDCPVSGTQLKDSSYQAKAGTGAGVSICLGGCLAKGAFSAKYGGVNYVTGPIVSTGETCSGDGSGGAPPAEPVPTPCGAGKCPGTVTINGTATTACYACDSVTTTKTTTSSASAASAASGAAPSASSAESGSSSSTTTCTGNACTTTRTTTKNNPDGSSSSSEETETKDKASYCAENSKDPACKGEDESQWGGACAGGFTCKGDAVQCAQAQAAYDLSCSVKTDPASTVVSAGVAAVGAGDRPAGHPGLDPQTLDVQSTLDATNPFSASCPSDIQINVIGTTVAIPLSSACDVLRVLGFVAVAFSLFGAGRFVVGAV